MSSLASLADKDTNREVPVSNPVSVLDAAILTGGFDRPYAYGLAMSLTARNVRLDVIGSDEVDSPEMHTTPDLKFFNLFGGKKPGKSLIGKVSCTFGNYARLMRYAATAKPKVFHILWNNKFQFFDRTLLMLYYKALGKKVTLTAHNVNQARRDGNDSWFNRITLRIQYHLTDNIFVHTQKMKDELVKDFGVGPQDVTVIRHPINDAFPDTELTPGEARQRLGIGKNEKTILFFGRIKPYKGLEDLLVAFQQLAAKDSHARLIIAGEAQKGHKDYLSEVKPLMVKELERGQIILKVQFIPDEDMEIYLKAADVMVLPYKEIFQSGVLFLSYSFGLPVVATDVGSFREEIVEGQTGFMCKPNDPADLAKALETYFESELYKDIDRQRQKLREYADEHHSWRAVAELTQSVYAKLSRGHRA
jgi:D-inositol-3-phosphate glycosyltransferase